MKMKSKRLLGVVETMEQKVDSNFPLTQPIFYRILFQEQSSI